MSTPPAGPAVRVGTPAGMLAVVPHLFGFTPDSSLVVISTDPQGRKITSSLRYDLPDPPDRALSADIAGHALMVLTRGHAGTAVVIGYGPGLLVTPVADAIREAAARAGLRLHDVLRVEDGRYWSYTCTDPSCCPPGGVPFDPAAHPAGTAMAAATGQPVLAGRAALEATVTPVTGAAAEAMSSATRTRRSHRDRPGPTRRPARPGRVRARGHPGRHRYLPQRRPGYRMRPLRLAHPRPGQHPGA